MWVPKKIDIENICAFHNASYKFINNVATLISGENLDNTSQKSNGSGKSALNEAIAFCIIGSPLRRVKDAEIINNEKQSAKTKLELYNSATNETMLIDRSVFRKGPQKISVELHGSPIDKATLSDYNHYILDTLGLTQDDIYGSFVLSSVLFIYFVNVSHLHKT